MFFDKKSFDDDIKPYLFDILFVSNQNFTIEHDKNVKNSRFFQNISNSRFFMPKLSNSRFFQVKWQPCSKKNLVYRISIQNNNYYFSISLLKTYTTHLIFFLHMWHTVFNWTKKLVKLKQIMLKKIVFLLLGFFKNKSCHIKKVQNW